MFLPSSTISLYRVCSTPLPFLFCSINLWGSYFLSAFLMCDRFHIQYTVRTFLHPCITRILYTKHNVSCTEAEFLNVIVTKVLRVFFLSIHSHLYYRILLPPLNKSDLKLVCNVNIVYKKPQVGELSRLCPETSTKLYVHEFGFWTRPQAKQTVWIKLSKDGRTKIIAR